MAFPFSQTLPLPIEPMSSPIGSFPSGGLTLACQIEKNSLIFSYRKSGEQKALATQGSAGQN